MNTSVLVVMGNDKAKWIVENYNILYKQFFKLGLDITQFGVVNDLLGIDYKSFSKGLTIFVEDEHKNASSLLVPLNQMQDCGDGIFISPANNIIVVGLDIFESFEKFKTILKNNLKIDYDNYCIKCFGVSETNLNNYLKEYKNSNNVFEYSVENSYGDSLIIFRFMSSINKTIQDNIVSTFVKDLKQAFYASKDIKLAEAIYEILDLRHLKISVAETFTGGNIASTIINQNKISKNIIEESVIVNSPNSINKILGVDEKILNQYSMVSAETAYEMATSLLNKTNCDMSLIAVGDFNVKTKDGNVVFFTAIGDKNAVNVYQHKAVVDKNFTINYATNTVIFELIKKLRQNALNISNYVV